MSHILCLGVNFYLPLIQASLVLLSGSSVGRGFYLFACCSTDKVIKRRLLLLRTLTVTSSPTYQATTSLNPHNHAERMTSPPYYK